MLKTLWEGGSLVFATGHFFYFWIRSWNGHSDQIRFFLEVVIETNDSGGSEYNSIKGVLNLQDSGESVNKSIKGVPNSKFQDSEESV